MYINIGTSDLSKKVWKTYAFVNSYIIYTTCNISSYTSIMFKYSKTLHVCLNVLLDSLSGRSR